MQKILVGDGRGNKFLATVSYRGELIVGPLSYSDTKFVELATANTAYNFYTAKVGKKFLITGIVAKADKQVSSTVDADVVVYESSASDSLTVDKVLFQAAMVQGDQVVLLPLNILTNEAVYINSKTTDDDVHMTIMGYYVDA